MRGAFSRRLILAAITVSAAALSSMASADYKGLDRVKAYDNYGAWRVSQHFTSERNWCSARADYEGGERLVLIASKEDWALRISHPDWRGVTIGQGYELDMRTDSGWGVGYRAWGYRGKDGDYSGLAMQTFPRALDHLAKAHSVYFVDLSGSVISALDLTGSARAIASLRSCKEDLATAGSFDAPPTSALVAPAETEAPVAAAPLQLEGEPSEEQVTLSATEMDAYAALTDSDLKPAKMKALPEGGADSIAEEAALPEPETAPTGFDLRPEDIPAGAKAALPDEEFSPNADEITPADIEAGLPEEGTPPNADEITPADIEAALEGIDLPTGEEATFPEPEIAPNGDETAVNDAEAALQDEELPAGAEAALLGAVPSPNTAAQPEEGQQR